MWTTADVFQHGKGEREREREGGGGEDNTNTVSTEHGEKIFQLLKSLPPTTARKPLKFRKLW